jgi:hypothetical protein
VSTAGAYLGVGTGTADARCREGKSGVLLRSRCGKIDKGTTGTVIKSTENLNEVSGEHRVDQTYDDR